MAKTPSEVLRKTKTTDNKDNKDDKKDEKKPRRNALLDFIANNKKTSK